MDGRLISCNDAGKILLDLRFDTRDTAVVYLHMSLRRARAPEKFVEWVRAKFALSQKKKW